MIILIACSCIVAYRKIKPDRKIGYWVMIFVTSITQSRIQSMSVHWLPPQSVITMTIYPNFFRVAITVITAKIPETIVSQSSLGGNKSKALQAESIIYLHAWSRVLHEQGKFLLSADFWNNVTISLDYTLGKQAPPPGTF